MSEEEIELQKLFYMYHNELEEEEFLISEVDDTPDDFFQFMNEVSPF